MVHSFLQFYQAFQNRMCLTRALLRCWMSQRNLQFPPLLPWQSRLPRRWPPFLQRQHSDSSSDSDGSSDSSEEERAQQFLELQEQVPRLVRWVGDVQWVLLELDGLEVMAQSHGLSSCIRVTVSCQGLQNVGFQEKHKEIGAFQDGPSC